MIHRLIFGHPKPGMSEKEYQRYWREHHGPLASKIPHLKPYLIASRIPVGQELSDAPFSGVSEIWFENEKTLQEAFQSKEYLQGARLDEPNFGALERTLVLDTTDYVLKEGDPLTKDSSLVKMVILLKRKPGMPLTNFRHYWLESHGPLMLSLPGIRRYVQCHVQDSFYVIGESSFDGVEQIWFDDTQAIENMMKSSEYKEQVMPDMANFVESKYIFSFVADEYWVVRPESR